MSKAIKNNNIISDFQENPLEGFKKVKNLVKDCASTFLKNAGPAGIMIEKIVEESNNLISKETKQELYDSVNRIIEYSKEGLNLIANKDYKGSFDKFKSAGKEVLSCIGNVFTAIKEGLERGFDSVKHGLGTAYKKLESLARGKEQSR